MTEDPYFDLFESAPVGYLILSDGVVTDANLTATRLLGMEREPLVGRPFLSLVFPGDHDIYHLHKHTIQRTGEPHACQLRLQRVFNGRPSGRMWVQLDERPSPDRARESRSWVTFSDISERIKAEEELWGSETRFADLFENAPVAYHSLDEQGKIVAVNREWLQLLGYAREEVIGRDFGDLWPPDTKHVFSERFMGLRRESPNGGEIRLLKKSGETVTVAPTGRIRLNAQGGFVTHCILTDITERKRAEEQLRESERWLRDSQRVARLGHYVYDIEHDRWEGSPALYEVLGIGEDYFRDFAGFIEIVHPADRELFTRHFTEEVIGNRRAFDLDYRIVRPRDGAERWAHGLGRVDWNEHGRPVAMFGTIQDITERKEMEEALRESEVQHRAVVETSPDGFWMVSPEGRLCEVNDAYVHNSGYTRDELLSMRISDLEAQESTEDVAKHMEKITTLGNDIFETLHRKKDGTVWRVEVSASCWPIGDGRHFVFLRDIAHRRRAEFLVQTRAKLAELESTSDIDTLLHLALDKAELLTGSCIGFFHFIDPDQAHVTLQTWSTNTLATMCAADGSGSHYPLDQAGVWAECIETRGPVIHNDYASLPNRKGLPQGHAPVVRELVVPVQRAGAFVAVMGVGNKTSDYTPDDVAAVEAVASMVTDLALRRRTQEEFEHFFELVPDLVCVVSADGRFRRLNPGWPRTFGYELDELIGEPLLDFVHPEDREVTTAVLAEQVSERIGVSGFTNRYRAKDGTYRWLEWNAAPMIGDLIFAAARDVTDRKQADERLQQYQARLRALAAELVVSAEQERGRLGIELHDGVGQVLSAAKMTAQTLAAEPLEPAAIEQAQRLVDLVGEAIREVRQLTSELAPAVLFELGLGAALLLLRDRYRQLYGLRCTVRIDEQSRHLRGDSAMFVFRIVREALNNVVRHSGVLRATVTVRKTPGWSIVGVSDRGVGFDPALIDNPGEGGGFGLFSVREECRALGGIMEISCSPGRGTRVTVRVPDRVDTAAS